MNISNKNKSLSESQKSENNSLNKKESLNPKNMKNLFISKNNNEELKTMNKENTIKKLLNKINHKQISEMLSLERYTFQKFNNFYSNEEDFYNIKVINEIICNESTHIVAIFKDYLISGDTSEFLQKLYSLKESKECLPKIFEYYDSCSVIFPNYVILPESKYIYKNIQRKQRVIDNQQDLEDKQEKIKKGLIKVKEDDIPVFNSVELDSILDQTDTSGIRRFFGIKNTESNLESKNISVENIIKKISTAENYSNENQIKKEKPKMNINFITINASKIKGRNYNRNMDSGYINSNNSKKNNNIVNSISSISKNTKVSSTTIDLETKNQNNVFYNSNNTIHVSNSLRNNNSSSKNNNISNNNSGIKKQNLINNLLANKNKEFIIKAFEELNKKKPNLFNTINTSQTKKKVKNNKNILPPTENKNKLKFNKISSSTNHMKTLSSSSSSPSQGLINVYHNKNTISMSKLAISNLQNTNQKAILSNRSGDKKKENLIRTLNIRESIPLTSRENLSPEYLNILNSKIQKIKSFNKRISTSIPSKKKLIQNSSYNSKTKQKDFHTINNETERNKQIYYRNRKFNFNLTESLSIPLNSKNDENKSHRDNTSKSPNVSPEKKIMRTYAHFHSNSSLIGNNNDNKRKIKKIRNSVFPNKEINFKGFQIKGFQELIQNNHYNSRNSKGSNSERIFISENNACKNNKVSDFSNKNFMDNYDTIHKK